MPRNAARQSASIQHARQVRGIRAPVRQEIVDAIQAEGPCTVAELGQRLDRAPDALYYHIRALLRLGLLIEREADQGVRGVVLDVPARPMTIDYRLDDHAQSQALNELVGAMLRLTHRDFESGLTSQGAVAHGAQRNIWAARSLSRLTPARVARLTRLLQQAVELMVESDDEPADEHAQLLALTFVLTPVERRVRTSPLNPRPSSRRGRTS